MMNSPASNEAEFYVLIKDGYICQDVFNFGIYALKDNLDAINGFVKWLERTAIEGEKEWLEDTSPDKCGLKEWQLSDDPFKHDPVNSKRVKDYLNSFSILRATTRLMKCCMPPHRLRDSIPYKMSGNGRADLDIAALKKRQRNSVCPASFMICSKFGN